MGQYFKAINLDKREVVCPWCLGGVAKLWEWAANPWGAIFTLLLRQSDRGGGGDFYGYRTQEIHLDDRDPVNSVMTQLGKGVAMEGRPIPAVKDAIPGRWAGNRVMLVGDYDSSKLWNKSKRFRNISEELVAAWNGFIELKEMQLKFRPDCSCRDKE